MKKKKWEPTRAERDRIRELVAPLLADFDRAMAPARQAIDRMLELLERATAPLLRVIDRMSAQVSKQWDSACVFHARFGDTPEAAHYLIGRLADHLETGEPMHEDAKVWLTAALRSINEGADANKALGLKLGNGQRPRRLDANNTRIRDPLIAIEVQRLVDQGIQLTRNRATTSRGSACSIVAEQMGLEESYIETAYYKHH